MEDDIYIWYQRSYKSNGRRYTTSDQRLTSYKSNGRRYTTSDIKD